MNNIDWDEKPELNITPLVDIMLVLLSILMLATQAIVYEEKINLPMGSGQTSEQDLKKLVVRMDVNRDVYYEEQKYTLEIFQTKVKFIIPQNTKKDTPIFIRADKNLKYDDVMTLLKSIKKLGFQKVSLATDG